MKQIQANKLEFQTTHLELIISGVLGGLTQDLIQLLKADSWQRGENLYATQSKLHDLSGKVAVSVVW